MSNNESSPDDGPPGVFGTLILQEPQSGEADGQWQLAEPFFYEARRCFAGCDKADCLLAASRPASDPDGLCRLVIAKGTRTDLASIPRSAEWLFRRYGVYTDAAVIHDYLCDDRFPGDQRFYADWTFRNLMTRDLKVFPPRAWVMWAAVSIATLKERRLGALIALAILQIGIWCVGFALIVTLRWWGLALIAGLCPLWFWAATRLAKKPSWWRAMVALPAIVTPMTPIIAIMAGLAVTLFMIKLIETRASKWFGGAAPAPARTSTRGSGPSATPAAPAAPAPAPAAPAPAKAPEPKGRYRVDP